DDYFQFNFRFGTGLGYLTKKFDRIDNYKDIAIGSHLNAALNLFYELKWIISKRVLVSGSIGLSHFSNGLIKTPNLGINIPTVSVGMAYIFHNNSTIISHVDTAFHKKKQKLNIQLFASGGIKQISLPGGSYYGIYTLSACFLKPLSKKREIGIGFDIFWDLSNVQTIEYNGFTVNHAYDVIKPGIYIGHQFDFSHFSIITQIGYYLYVKDKYVEPIYTRFALRYLFSNRIMLNLALLTHYATADFIEWGIGYSLK
ncbi:MAG: acyloxyacyl hydrolase, partial [Bacteroidales bacterium]